MQQIQQTSLKHSIRWLLVSFALLLSSLSVLLILAYSWVVEDNIFNRMLHSEAQYIQHRYDTQGVEVAPRHPFMTLYASWAALPETLQLLRQQSPDRIEFPLPGKGTIHTKTVQLGEHTRVLAANVSEYEVSKDYLPKLLPWVVISVCGVCLIALAIAWYLSNSIVKPLHYLTETVKQHQGQDSLYFDRQFAGNEIGYLASVIESDFNRLQKALRREADFTRDVSHELRTPVSVIKMIAANLTPQIPITEQSLEQLRGSAQQLGQTIDILLALARDESVEKRSLCLLEVIQDCVINHAVFSRHGQSVDDINVPGSYRVVANENLLHLLINNVLDNVVKHASTLRLTMTLHEHTLTITNPLTVRPQGNLLAPGVKSAGSTGIGQGLHLIQRISAQFGWQLSIRTHQNRFEIAISFQ